MRGGAERVVEKIVNGLKEKGHKVFIISTSPKKENPPNPPKAEQVVDGAENIYYLKSIFHNLDKIPFIFRFFYHLWDSFNFINYYKIKKILKKENPDIVMTHALQGIGSLIPCLIKKLKIKHIHTLHDIQLLHPSGLMFYKKEGIISTMHAKIFQFLNKILFKSPNIVISPSKWLLDIHLEKGFFPKSTKKVIANIFSKKFKNLEEKEKTEKNKIKFLYVGQIEDHKGVDILVKAFNIALGASLEHTLKLTIVGPGSRLDQIKKLAQGKEDINILGRKENEEVLKIMSESDCLIVPSLCYENSPTVIYEAIEAGLSLITSKIGGIPEFVEKYNGLMFEPGNISQLAEKIIFVAKNSKDDNRKISLDQKDYIEELLA